MDREFLRGMTRQNLKNELFKIEENYMKVYDRYYSNEQSRDDAFLKDLVDLIQGVSAVLEVYVRNGFEIHPNYALEKLNWSKSFLESNIRYFEAKMEREENNE